MKIRKEKKLVEKFFAEDSDSSGGKEPDELEINVLPSSSTTAVCFCFFVTFDGSVENWIFFPLNILQNGEISKVKNFDELGISKWLCSQLQRLAVKTPTPVQVSVIFSYTIFSCLIESLIIIK